MPDIGALAHAQSGELHWRSADRARTCSHLLEVLMSESATVRIPEPMPMFGPVQLAAAGFLARYSGRTRDAYAPDLKTYFAWCAARGTEVFEMTRPHVEVYVRWMEEQRHYAPATTAGRLSTVAGYYRFAVIDGYLDRSPAEYGAARTSRRSHRSSDWTGCSLVPDATTARASTPDEAALITMLGLLGLRIGEACSGDVEDMGTERGHRTLHIIGKGNKPALIPLPVPVARTLDLAAAERVSGPLLRTRTGRRMDRNAASRIVHRLARRAGIEHHVGCHALRHAFIDAGVPLRDVQIAARHADPRTTTRYDRARGNLDRHANYVVAAFIAGAA
jgi:integrase/recombinase XerD